MTIIGNLFVAILQIIVGYLFLFMGAFVGLGLLLNDLGLVSADNPDPWWNTPLVFLSFVLTASLGVWFVGWVASKIHMSSFDAKKVWWRTFAGSAIGILIVSGLYLLLGAVGMLPVFVAVFGAFTGYYLQPKRKS